MGCVCPLSYYTLICLELFKASQTKKKRRQTWVVAACELCHSYSLCLCCNICCTAVVCLHSSPHTTVYSRLPEIFSAGIVSVTVFYSPYTTGCSCFWLFFATRPSKCHQHHKQHLCFLGWCKLVALCRRCFDVNYIFVACFCSFTVKVPGNGELTMYCLDILLKLFILLYTQGITRICCNLFV